MNAITTPPTDGILTKNDATNNSTRPELETTASVSPDQSPTSKSRSASKLDSLILLESEKMAPDYSIHFLGYRNPDGGSAPFPLHPCSDRQEDAQQQSPSTATRKRRFHRRCSVTKYSLAETSRRAINIQIAAQEALRQMRSNGCLPIAQRKLSV